MSRIILFSVKAYNKIVHLLFKSFAKIVVFFPLKALISFYNKLIMYITTEYIIKQMMNCGKNASISFPITTHGLNYIIVGDNFRSFPRVRIEAYDRYFDDVFTPEIIIGDNVSINYDCHIGCTNRIRIGNNVLIASKVYITDHFHGDTSKIDVSVPPVFRPIFSKGPVVVEDNVWIGEGVAIMPNVTIGKNSIIGANSVVTKSVPENSIAAGNPAKILRRITDE